MCQRRVAPMPKPGSLHHWPLDTPSEMNGRVDVKPAIVTLALLRPAQEVGHRAAIPQSLKFSCHVGSFRVGQQSVKLAIGAQRQSSGALCDNAGAIL